MRSLEEIRKEYAELCMKIGNVEVQKERLIKQFNGLIAKHDAELVPLHEKCAQLEMEGQQVKTVEEEIRKAKENTSNSELPSHHDIESHA